MAEATFAAPISSAASCPISARSFRVPYQIGQVRESCSHDAMCVSELVAHVLIRASFVPDAQTQEMRNLLPTRKQLVREQSSHVLRVQKTLEDANIKLDSVLSDLMGKSGRAMIEALIAGETNPVKLAALADRRAKASHDEFR